MRVSDLPPATTAGTARYWTNQQAAARDHVSVTAYVRHGRERTYSIEFFRPAVGGTSLSWFVRGDCQITRYHHVAGAHWEFLREITHLLHLGVPGTTTSGTRSGDPSHTYSYSPVPLTRLGDEHAAFRAESAGDEFAFTTRAFVFRRGVYVALIRIMGLQGLPQGRALHFAAIVDRRIRTDVARS